MNIAGRPHAQSTQWAILANEQDVSQADSCSTISAIRFPALALARRALATGGAAPTVLNAADEIAVGEFIAGRIGFPAITALVEATLDAAAARGLLAEPATIDAALAIDHIARSIALALLPEIAVKSS